MVSTFALGVAALAAEREAPQQRHVCAMDVREAGFVQHGPVVAPLASNAQQLAALLIGSISGADRRRDPAPKHILRLATVLHPRSSAG